jgi:hypothetical protein
VQLDVPVVVAPNGFARAFEGFPDEADRHRSDRCVSIVRNGTAAMNAARGGSTRPRARAAPTPPK